MSALPRFAYHRPGSLEEALELLSEHAAGARLLAGGTDLIGKLRAGALPCEHLVSLGRVRELERLDHDEAQGLGIGAGVRVSDVGRHPEVAARYPALAHACRVMATVQVRNMATVAGNLVNGSPCADTAAPLLVYDARLELARKGGRREVALSDFHRGPGEVDLEPGELVERIRLGPPPERSASSYQRISARSRVDMAAASAAACLSLHPDGRVRRARLALGAVAPTPMRCPEAEALLEEQTPDDGLLRRAAAACEEAARPIDDVRATADWRRAMVGVLVRRALEQCLAGGGGE